MTTSVALAGVPETMLWTLHGGAGEAARSDPLLGDPECLRVYRSIDYVRHFGESDRGLAIRANAFDDVIPPSLAQRRGGPPASSTTDEPVIPEVVAVRERFFPSTDRHRNGARSAMDFSPLDEIDFSRGVFVSAQGLFMYFERSQVQRLCTAVISHFRGLVLMFDEVARWFTRRTQIGAALTEHYRIPKMPWGINTGEDADQVRVWSDPIVDVDVAAYGPSRGIVATQGPGDAT